MDLLEELFVQEGIIFDPDTALPDIDLAFQDVASRQIVSLVQAVEELTGTVQEVWTLFLLFLLSSSPRWQL